MKSLLFIGKLKKKHYVFYNQGTHGKLHAKFGWIWTNLWLSQKNYF